MEFMHSCPLNDCVDTQFLVKIACMRIISIVCDNINPGKHCILNILPSLQIIQLHV